MTTPNSLSVLKRLPRKSLLATAAVISVLTVVGIGTHALTSHAASQSAALAPTPVTIAVVQEQNVSPWEDFSGHLEAVDRVDIRPRVAGAIKAIHFHEGALLKTGDLLVTIDPAPSRPTPPAPGPMFPPPRPA